MPEGFNYTRFEYNGQMLTMNAIAELEGIVSITLKKKYNETQDIYEAVKLAKEAQAKERERIVQIPYNGQMLTIPKIAKLEGVAQNTLRRKYEQTHDIYESVKFAKESKLSEKYQITRVTYNGQTLAISAIAELEGISDGALRKNYNKTQDIYEAVKLTKEAKERKKEETTRIPYNGKILSISAIANLEDINRDALTKSYAKTQDIYEAVKVAKENQTKQHDRTVQIPYNGQLLSIFAIAELEGVNQVSLRKKYNEVKNIYEAVKITKENQSTRKEKIIQIPYDGRILSIFAIAKLEGLNKKTLKNKYNETNDIYEAVKLAKEAQAKERERTNQISYNGKMLSFTAIAELEGVSATNLINKYNKTQDIYKAVKSAKESKTRKEESITQIPYSGQILPISAIAKLENLPLTTLVSKFEKTQDINKAVMLCKSIKLRRERRKSIVQTKEFGNLTYYDLSLIIGIKYSELEKLLEQGNSIDDIIDSKGHTSKNSNTRENIKLENGQSLPEYCIENKLNYSCIYWAMKTYGKTLEEAVASYNKNGQATPKSWIFEKYGLLFKHLMLKESIDINRVVSYMRKDYLPMEQAVEKYIIRSNAKKENLDQDWMEELYDVLSDDFLSKEDYDGYVQTFYVDEQEENCVKESKEKINAVKRKLLLFELSDVLREGIFTQEEEKRLFEEYNITEEEVDVIFNDLYDRFTDPGVLMGKDQQEIISPEVEQKRKDQISKYKQMARDINQDNNILVMMRFMVGPNVESNEECRTELHKELQKENKQVDVGQ